MDHKEKRSLQGKVAKWKYLDKIKPFLQRDDDGKEEVEMLIGANCSRCSRCVTGPIINKISSSSDYRSVENNNIRFVVQDELKEHGLGEIMLKLFNQDFGENSEADGWDRI